MISLDDERPLTVNGVRGWYFVGGEGPAVVILASPFGRAKSYRPTVEHLSKANRVFTIELPGCGRADRLPRPWSLAEYASWSAGALEALELHDVTLVGHSHSGAIPIVVAARQPERIGRIVVVDSIGAGGPHSLLRTMWGRAVDAALELDVVFTKGHHVLGNAFTHTGNYFAQTWRSLRADVTAEAERVQVPALIAWGRRDHVLPPRCAIDFARHLPHSTIYFSDRGAHEWIIQRPAEFAAAVNRFLQAHTGMDASVVADAGVAR